ncbi:MAG: hypothetical protein HOQ43_21380 [Glycomyces artemisiae]|uniref:Uncharacterized protein n=1 Tax=Glycomyces artemisiae TaxID=1076443 RepID=A0A850CGM5_9ACTN|nr:hypothetical protein [Glycomyces artemisiae]
MPSNPEIPEPAPRSVPMRLLHRLTPPRPGDVLLTAHVGPAGEAVTLWGPDALAERIFGYVEYANGVRSPASQVPPWSARVVVAAPDGRQTVTEIDGMTLAFPNLQPLPGGRLLIVGTRCRVSAGIAEHNAVVIDPAGRIARTGTFGDGIADVQTTPSGRIIAAYFDEGVFGNNGWGGTGAPEPIGAPGLVEFDSDLRQVWSYSFDDPEAPWIGDCYALNLIDETVWVSVYPDFPLVRIDKQRVTMWQNDVAAGAHGFLIDDGAAGWIGGYGAGPDTLTTGTLIESGTVLRETFHIGTDDGCDFAATFARGMRLHRFTDTGDWFVLDLAAAGLTRPGA